MTSAIRPFLLLLGLCLFLASGTGAQEVGDIDLVDQDGGRFRLSSLRGQVVILVFGFTHCPHICPVEMARASAALRELEGGGQGVAGVFVTVDPERDSPEVIKAYLGNFHPDFIGLSGTPAALGAVADHYRVKQQRQTLADGSYLIDHGYSLYILNQRGDVEVAVLPGLPPSHIASLVQELLQDSP